jgi:hypothetical protein
MEVEAGQTDADGLKRGEATMRVLFTIFLVLDFALACFVGVKFFHL